MKEIVSIEKVLNSRCSCDFDGNPKQNHWGNFIKNKHPPQRIIKRVLRCCRVLQFSDGKLSIWFENEHLFLGFEKTNDLFETRLLHIESGMQQEAVYLACTALGLGTCIHNLGINGTEYKNKMATAKHLILEKADSYEAGKFSTAPPSPEKPFKKGKNLSEPERDGNVECLPELEELTLFRDTGTQADETDISQLLWAAKGRTPHYIKSHPWGLTIPTWGGGQNYTNVYLVKKNKLFRYINWTTRFLGAHARYARYARYLSWKIGYPTHDIKPLRNVNISDHLDGADIAIILSRNEKTNRALWEVGYMLENMFLQTKSLGISYKSKVFTKEEIGKLERNGISEAVAVLLL
ncbi:MAG: hypothetical protein OEW62_02030 [Candidatus Bathyarchaeota archaeon]|nr:hypothetical protein [Candidatus Bathyarchaeota archaeon]MDH5595120.1 hypothetical protein [Candidatus Bathyarchaeota archaeon]